MRSVAYLSPLRICQPLLGFGKVQGISQDGNTFGTRREGTECSELALTEEGAKDEEGEGCYSGDEDGLRCGSHWQIDRYLIGARLDSGWSQEIDMGGLRDDRWWRDGEERGGSFAQVVA